MKNGTYFRTGGNALKRDRTDTEDQDKFNGKSQPDPAGAESSPLSETLPAIELLRRPEINWEVFSDIVSSPLEKELGEKISVSVKYEGYIERQMRQVDKFRRMEILKFPEDFDFEQVHGLSAEGRQKLLKYMPGTLGQASRISGIPPTDIQLLWVAVESRRRSGEKADSDG